MAGVKWPPPAMTIQQRDVTSIYAYVRARDKLAAEPDPAKTRFAPAREGAGAAFCKRRQERSQKIAEFKRQLGEKKRDTIWKLATFEGELRRGAGQRVLISENAPTSRTHV